MNEYDKRAIRLADLRSDAKNGNALMDELDREWFAAGVAAFRCGTPAAELWSDAHRAGYHVAKVIQAALMETRFWGGAPVMEVIQ